MYLGVNIDHVATLRNARGVSYPSINQAAASAHRGGADRITAHLREDRRHIRDQDVADLSKTLAIGLNLEVAPKEEMLDVIGENSPYSVCLVPEKREELTTEGGLDLISRGKQVRAFIQEVRRISPSTKISLFVEPEEEIVEAGAALEVDILELHTGAYANEESEKNLSRIREAAALGRRLGLVIHAGHGLHMGNAKAVSRIKDISELNIGHSIVSEAIFHGLEEAVRRMKELIS